MFADPVKKYVRPAVGNVYLMTDRRRRTADGNPVQVEILSLDEMLGTARLRYTHSTFCTTVKQSRLNINGHYRFLHNLNEVKS